MSIEERVDRELKEAAKARDAVTLSTLRMVRAAFHNKEIELRRKLEEKELIQVLTSMAKQRKDSMEQFEQGGRSDLVERESQELAIIKAYMPEEMSEQEIRDAIARAVDETGASGVKDMGAVMKALMPVIAGKADGKIVSGLVREILGS